MSFSGPAGICYANEAEVPALLFGFKWFANSKLGPLIVEGDSSNTIAWATKNSNRPWRLHNFVTEIRDLVSVIMPTIKHRRRSTNEVVDQLAKDGVLREFMSIFIAPEMEDLFRGLVMSESCVMPILITFPSILSAISAASALKHGQEVHVQMIKSGLEDEMGISNSLITIWLTDAKKIIKAMSKRDFYTWNVLMNGYSISGHYYDTIILFLDMLEQGMHFHQLAFSFLLTTCSRLASLQFSKHIINAISVFERMERRDVFSWPGMITGFGHDYESVNLFERMKAEGVKPNSFGRAEKLVETSIALIGTKWNFCLSLWRVLLGVCYAHKQLELGVLAATRILEMEPEDEHTHILLANLYAAFGMWDDAVRVRRLMKDRGLKRDVGFSWIDIGSRRNIFIAGDVTQQNREAIYEKRAVHDVDESQKEAIISYYCE
ncbi:putative pentatricopeptide repeat-containing protein At3g23330 [Tasmannia lanceolata]|uniref:putative pentatricopeptide repeat-containing protein At3g23330 n=1 Tax=Tasmannia lanceolata TaxID=3420 RepID=UPI004063133F